MAYEEVTDLGTDNVIALGGFNKKTRKDNPTSIEGYYLGSREVPSKLSKNGLAKIHVFQTAKGNVGVWGKTDLDNKLIGVTPGTMTLVKFDRMQKTSTGEMYKYKVAVDKDNTVAVSAQAPAATNDSASTDDSYNDEAFANEDIDTASDEEDAAQALALAAAERKAKVEALLAKGKNRTAKN
jgi:hypothetical protein